MEHIKHSGFVINVKSLLRNHSKELAVVQEFYPDAGIKYKDKDDYQRCWCLPSDHILVELQAFVESEICKDLLAEIEIGIIGNWYDGFLDNGEGAECPFDDNEAYIVFEKQLVDNVMVFMRRYDIPSRMLKHCVWCETDHV